MKLNLLEFVSELIFACVPLPCVLVCRVPTWGTHGHAKFIFLINLIVNNEIIMYYFYRLIKFYNLILAKNDFMSV